MAPWISASWPYQTTQPQWLTTALMSPSSSYTWATGQLQLGPEHSARPEEGPRQAQKPESRMHMPRAPCEPHLLTPVARPSPGRVHSVAVGAVNICDAGLQ